MTGETRWVYAVLSGLGTHSLLLMVELCFTYLLKSMLTCCVKQTNENTYKICDHADQAYVTLIILLSLEPSIYTCCSKIFREILILPSFSQL